MTDVLKQVDATCIALQSHRCGPLWV